MAKRESPEIVAARLRDWLWRYYHLAEKEDADTERAIASALPYVEDAEHRVGRPNRLELAAWKLRNSIDLGTDSFFEALANLYETLDAIKPSRRKRTVTPPSPPSGDAQNGE